MLDLSDDSGIETLLLTGSEKIRIHAGGTWAADEYERLFCECSKGERALWLVGQRVEFGKGNPHLLLEQGDEHQFGHPCDRRPQKGRLDLSGRHQVRQFRRIALPKLQGYAGTLRAELTEERGRQLMNRHRHGEPNGNAPCQAFGRAGSLADGSLHISQNGPGLLQENSSTRCQFHPSRVTVEEAKSEFLFQLLHLLA
jgi:hypothetical protein